MTQPTTFLTVAEVAAELNVHVSTVYRLVRSGELAGIKVGTAVRVRRSAVDAYINGAPAEVGATS